MTALLISLTLIYAAAALSLKLTRKIRFDRIKRRYAAKFGLLSFEDKVRLLFADIGTQIEHNERQAHRYIRESDKSMNVASLLDAKISNERDIIRKCRNFGVFNEARLDTYFSALVKKHWSAMKLTGEWNLECIEVDLEYLFENRIRLFAVFHNSARSHGHSIADDLDKLAG